MTTKKRRQAQKSPATRKSPRAVQQTSDAERPQRNDSEARKATDDSAEDRADHRTGADPARFPVVGLGASAGGLLALERFFQLVPPDSGMAYVVITHQSPDRPTLLPDLLSKRAQIPVAAAVDRMRILPNHVYVSPPGCCLQVRNEQLRVLPLDPNEPSLPIDMFFRSLAHNEGDQAIAIVLSGTGSDGTIGITEVKSSFGMVMAQDPQSAQYPGMPSSAIATQLVDYVLAPERMPEQLMRYMRGPAQKPEPPNLAEEAEADGALQTILLVLRSRTGHDFRAYKKSTIRRRIERRMHVHGIAQANDYARFLEHTAYEVDALFKELLISVTSFFRDPEAFAALEHELTKLIELKPDDDPLRIWVPGCATGEEAYSIAILVREAMQRLNRDVKVQIFATDLDQQAVDVGRSGRYPEGIAADITPARLNRFFTREEGGYRINKDIRELIVFAIQNVIKDPPFTKLDLLSCRNLLIYLEPELQKRVLSLFSYSLRSTGLLLLGTSESVSGFDDRFATLDKRWKLFQRRQSSPSHMLPDFPGDLPHVAAGGRGPAPHRDTPRVGGGVTPMAERLLLSTFVPPSVVVSERGELIYVHGRVGQFFEPAPGEPTHNVFNMTREGLRLELPAAIRQAASTQAPIVRRGLQVKTNGGFSAVRLTVRKLAEPEALRGTFVVSFEIEPEVEPQPKARRSANKGFDRIAALEEELKRTRENLQGTIEELETSNEELKSTNEELQSTNEELQSANEELETSREEMQSLNEELQTVNAELEERNRALSQTNDDMQNLLNSTDVATVFLDDKLNIKRFTTQAKKVFSMIDTDIGRPISDLAANLRYDALLEDAQDVLRTLVFREREIQTKEGAWRLMRLMPYRTHENLIDGLVITFVDIDRLRRAEQSAQEARTFAESTIDALPTGVLVLDPELKVRSANRAFYRMVESDPKHVVGENVEHLAGGYWDDSSNLLERLRGVLKTGERMSEVRVRTKFPRIGTKDFAVTAQRMPDAMDLLLLTIDDKNSVDA